LLRITIGFPPSAKSKRALACDANTSRARKTAKCRRAGVFTAAAQILFGANDEDLRRKQKYQHTLGRNITGGARTRVLRIRAGAFAGFSLNKKNLSLAHALAPHSQVSGRNSLAAAVLPPPTPAFCYLRSRLPFSLGARFRFGALFRFFVPRPPRSVPLGAVASFPRPQKTFSNASIPPR
jgi:hypothetical protein